MAMNYGQQNQFGYGQPINGYTQPQYSVRPVSSREEAIAQSVDYFSLGLIMPDIGHGMMYLKRFNQNTGSADFYDFKVSQPEEPIKYATLADLENLRSELIGAKKQKKRIEEDDYE